MVQLVIALHIYLHSILFVSLPFSCRSRTNRNISVSDAFPRLIFFHFFLPAYGHIDGRHTHHEHQHLYRRTNTYPSKFSARVPKCSNDLVEIGKKRTIRQNRASFLFLINLSLAFLARVHQHEKKTKTMKRQIDIPAGVEKVFHFFSTRLSLLIFHVFTPTVEFSSSLYKPTGRF